MIYDRSLVEYWGNFRVRHGAVDTQRWISGKAPLCERKYRYAELIPMGRAVRDLTNSSMSKQKKQGLSPQDPRARKMLSFRRDETFGFTVMLIITRLADIHHHRPQNLASLKSSKVFDLFQKTLLFRILITHLWHREQDNSGIESYGSFQFEDIRLALICLNCDNS
ncbi:hypothetical protein E6O75_ATG07464 [Venturia nashicola]|uniref:Uncharacterized protein n=1 Tax=Venturia nashicola TaxID=86259 RepID=A0A4Z1PBV0_9PEZI|nr:hypothetical protein E6O75_ATG07464 [Venturia nashicola]